MTDQQERGIDDVTLKMRLEIKRRIEIRES